jgi:hypothetical protein
MNDFFEWERFVRLLRAQWAESWREYAWFIAVTAMIDVIFILIMFSSESRNSFSSFQFSGQIGWYCSGLFGSGILFAGRHFRHLTQPGAALTSLMRPASMFEKWLLAFSVVGVLYPLAYTLAYALLNFPVVELARHWHHACETCEASTPLYDFSFYIPFLSTGQQARPGNGLQLFYKNQVFFLLLLWTLQALIVGGTLYFKRSPVLRTLLSLFVLAIALIWLGQAPQQGAFWSAIGSETVPYSLLESSLSLALWAGLPLLLWLSVYFHLTEREVA